jgi:hypothetical protein
VILSVVFSDIEAFDHIDPATLLSGNPEPDISRKWRNNPILAGISIGYIKATKSASIESTTEPFQFPL